MGAISASDTLALYDSKTFTILFMDVEADWYSRLFVVDLRSPWCLVLPAR